MTAHAWRLPFSLDPLMAEAKRRARNRRALLAGAVAMLVGGVAAGVIVASAPSFTPTRPMQSALAGNVLFGGPVVFDPGTKFGFPLRLRNEAGQTITVERVRAALAPGAPLQQIGTRWSTYASPRLLGAYEDLGAESPRIVPFDLRPGQSALATLSFRLGSCRAATIAHTPLYVSGQPFSTLVRKGEPPVRKITVVYRSASGATVLQRFFEGFTFYRSGHGCS
jgi:hypothetical protein